MFGCLLTVRGITYGKTSVDFHTYSNNCSKKNIFNDEIKDRINMWCRVISLKLPHPVRKSLPFFSLNQENHDIFSKKKKKNDIGIKF